MSLFQTKGAGVVLAMMFLFVISGCTGDGWTRENSTGLPAKPKVEQPGTPTCDCPTKGTYCRIEAAGKSLKCQIFLGGCETNTSVCKVEPGSSKINACDDTDASTIEVWQDTKGTNASVWTLWSQDRFVCKSGTMSLSCVDLGCSAGYVCNHMSGTCELADPNFFPCKTMTCTPDTEECICENGNVLCYERQGLCFHKNGVEACAAKDKSWWTVTCFSGTTCQAGKCVQSSPSGCAVNGCPSGQSCNSATGQCFVPGGGQTTPGYDHTFCAWASVTAKGAYGGQTNTLNATSTKDWTDMSDNKDVGGWYPVTTGGQTKYCRGVTSLARGIRVLIQTADGDFPGWVQTGSGKQYQLPFTIYGSWDGGNLMSVTPNSQDCIGGEVNKATCQLNKGTLTNVYGAVFPSPWQP